MSVRPNHPPLWVLRQTILPNGARLSKKPEEDWKPQQQTTLPIVVNENRERFFKNWDKAFPSASRNFLSSGLPPCGNLDRNEYRYYVGVRELSSSWSKCRLCQTSFTNEDNRKNHKIGCQKKLEAAYMLLLMDMKCVICDAKVKRASWGVPMCQPCEERWMFDVNPPAALCAAVGEAIRRDNVKVRLGV